MDNDEAIEEALRLSRLRANSPADYLIETLGERTVDRLVAALGNGVPPPSLGVLARWWQLETYLRQLVYIQLKALHGSDWEASLKNNPRNRQGKAAESAYMSSPDDGYLLAHLGVFDLFELIEDNWDECSHGIGLPLEIWKGRVAELRPIRNRLAHCRRPHSDDAARIEQTLRDLEVGARCALGAYVAWRPVHQDFDDPVAEAWVRMSHPEASLVDHGRDNKGIEFMLQAARLPWAAPVTGQLAESPGCFWVMSVYLRNHHIVLDEYWSEPSVQNLLPHIGHVIRPHENSIAVTLPSKLDSDLTADLIGALFRSVFDAARPGDSSSPLRLRRAVPEPDMRADDEGILSTLSWLDATDPLTVFEAH